jgi:hypothetical protein
LRADTPELVAIDERTAALVRTPRSHQEFAQVLRYGVTEKYDTHVDCEYIMLSYHAVKKKLQPCHENLQYLRVY